MRIHDDIKYLLQQAIRQVDSAADGNLSLQLRLQIRSLLARHYDDDRYAVACFRLAKRLIPKWNTVVHDLRYKNLPNQILTSCRQAIFKELPNGTLSEEVNKCADQLAYVFTDLESIKRPPSFAHYAAFSSAAIALDYLPLNIFTNVDTDYSIEADLFDTPAFAAMDVAGALLDDASDVETRRAFWRIWLTDELPYVLSESALNKLF